MVALLVALGTGVALGIQATINSLNGEVVGPMGTGLLVIIVGGILAAIGLALFLNRLPAIRWATVRQVQFGLLAAGALAIVAIAGTAFALPRTGIAAGLSAIILGQMLAAVVIDTTGWGGIDPIRLNVARLAGLILLAVATWLLVPRATPN